MYQGNPRKVFPPEIGVLQALYLEKRDIVVALTTCFQSAGILASPDRIYLL